MEYFLQQRLILLHIRCIYTGGTMSPRMKQKKKLYVVMYIIPFIGIRNGEWRFFFLANSIISFLYTSFRCVSDASQSEGDLEIKEK